VASTKWLTTSGSWYVGANWSSGVVPGSGIALDDVATLDAPGSYTVKVGNADVTSIGSVNVNASGATLGVSLQGLTVNNALTLNSGRLLLQGTLKGGSLVMNGGVVMRNNLAALDGVRVQGTLDMAAPYHFGVLTLLNYAPLTLLNNVSFVAADGISPGLLRVGGSALTFGTSALFDYASIDFAAGYHTASSLNLGATSDAVGETVTFGRNALLDVASTVSVTLGGNGTLVNGGAINVEGTLTVGPLVNLTQAAQPGTLTLQSGGTLVFAAPTVFGSTITFKDPTAQLVFQGSGAVGATLNGFRSGDTIDLQGLANSSSLALSLVNGALHVDQGGVSVGNFQLTGGVGAYSVDQFSLAADPSGGTLLQTTHALDPLFDSSFYLAHNPDVAAAGVDPYQHYLTYGWHEGRNPDALFDTSYYLAQNPDVRMAGVNPLLHFESNGWQEGREPSLMFSDAKYLAAYPDVAAAKLNPLVDYLSHGQSAGRMAFLAGGTAPADPLVDAAYYSKQPGATVVPAGAAGQQQAAADYNAGGWQKGLNPDALFDTQYYLSHNPDVAAAGVNPLLHYEQYGWTEGRDPSAQFSTHKYLAAYSDVKAASLDPLLHYVVYGQGEGRTAFAA